MIIRKISAFVLASLLAGTAFAENVTLVDCTGAKVTVDLPSELVDIINENRTSIEAALAQNKITAATIQDVSSKVNDAYGKLGDYGLDSANPITDAQDGLDELCDIIVDVVPDSQMQQNVWAKAWLGSIFHIGGGLNTGLSFMNISPLLDAVDSLGISTSGIPSSIPFPTMTVDLRASLPFFPLDIGAAFSLLDTRKISGVSSVLNDVALEFYNFGFDARYPLIKKGPLGSMLSLGAGFYYSKGGVSFKDDDASASLNYKAATFKLDAQYSLKLAVLVPFVGARVALTQASADWEIDVDWKSVYKDESSYVAMAQDWGLLPTKFSGGSSCKFTESIRPQIYGGIGLDVLCFDITASGCFDFNTRIPSAAFSLRLSF
ncbi:MAG: hypothetical protein IJR93_08920 [Treponema sp.]|nr:hypothetical protein [Treponema sp.]MBQ7167048.1 hypothetical protein [Treponema sp.]